jgi:protein-disulfide isomerase/uncharacterized membrane protein
VTTGIEKEPAAGPDARAGKADSSTPTPESVPVRSRLVLRWRIAFLVFATVGACLSADLMRLHVKVHTDPEYHSYCAISERANCETVAASEHAVVFDLPLALWGLLAYLAMGALAVWGLRRPATPPSWPFGMLYALTAFSSVVSVYLFAISHFVVQSLCVVCMGTYLVNFILLFIAMSEIHRLGLGPVAALHAELRSALRERFPRFALFVGVFPAAALVTGISIPHYGHVEVSRGPGGAEVGTTPEGHPWIGAAHPTLTITEFSDYQCPHCSRGHDEMRKLIEAYPERVRLVHRHYPLDHHCNERMTRPFHPHACEYAKMAACAQKQDRFWEANDYLFANGRRRDPVQADELALEIDGDTDKLIQCVQDDAASVPIQEDLEAGRKLSIRGTPTFVIGDRIYPGQIPPEVIRKALGE